MIPVLFRFTFESHFAQVILYLLAVGMVGYIAFSSWRGAVGEKHEGGSWMPGLRNPKTRRLVARSLVDRLGRTALFTAIALALVKFGLNYALPASAFLGGKGEGIPIHTYGVMLATGFLLAVGLAARLAEREWPGQEGLKKREQILDLSFWVLVGGIGGSKILFILVNWKDYFGHGKIDIVEVLSGGLVFYGGLLGAMATSFWFARKNKMEWMRLADLAIPTVSLGQCFGRLGCFSAGCCWGRFTPEHFRLGVHFPGAAAAKDIFGHVVNTASLAFQTQSQDGRWIIPATGQVFHQAVPGAERVSQWVSEHGHTLAIHPTQLYESFGQLCMFAFLLFMRRYRRFHGQILGMWLVGYAFLRTTVELFRGDLERGTLAGLIESMGLSSLADKISPEAWYNISTSEFISIVMLAAGLGILLRGSRKVLARRTTSTMGAAVGF